MDQSIIDEDVRVALDVLTSVLFIFWFFMLFLEE